MCIRDSLSIYAVSATDWNLLGSESLTASQIADTEVVFSNPIPYIAEMLLRDFVLAFEVVSVLLLAAVLGAMSLVRGR